MHIRSVAVYKGSRSVAGPFVATVCDERNMHSWIVGLACLSLLGYSIPIIETVPVGTSLGSLVSGPSKHERHAQFAEGIKEWFRNVKNRIFGGPSDSEVLPPVEAGRMMMELENEDMEERRRNDPGGFFLDLANLSFDPRTDWGFHLGRWYFIRKSYDTSTIDWSTYRPPSYSDWPMSREEPDDIAPSFTTARPDEEITSSEPMSTTEIPEGKIEDNETGSTRGDRSTEVLSPSG